MEKEQLKRIFDFLEEKEQQNPPFMWKLKNDIPLTEEDLDIEGDLDLTNSNIESLPEGLEVSGDLILSYCENINSLPEGLIVRGNLHLSYSNITSLPKGLKVGGSLYIQRTKIKSLPEGLEVGGYLNINTTPLTKYTDDQLREMIYPGFIKGKIWR